MEQDTRSSQYRRHPPQLYLTHVERENPNEVSGVVDILSKPTVRKAELFSRKRKGQDVNFDIRVSRCFGDKIFNTMERVFI
ncbi:hypothetical protein Krac_8129 [Ktedonobacter racemifer DSM 44963]|uniref:Uncharacterized protein n=1 Tax=Ktedonobacter racemifer DSM 44963 TaxID=485913 RepID=D6TM13_KTERA|nr:hypothetical protein Krac_8129 [Ktedonobacter racemifer DSM 44963]